jgi:hypothetical protein
MSSVAHFRTRIMRIYAYLAEISRWVWPAERTVTSRLWPCVTLPRPRKKIRWSNRCSECNRRRGVDEWMRFLRIDWNSLSLRQRSLDSWFPVLQLRGANQLFITLVQYRQLWDNLVLYRQERASFKPPCDVRCTITKSHAADLWPAAQSMPCDLLRFHPKHWTPAGGQWSPNLRLALFVLVDTKSSIGYHECIASCLNSRSWELSRE